MRKLCLELIHKRLQFLLACLGDTEVFLQLLKGWAGSRDVKRLGHDC